MNVLSLFDGIGCGAEALAQLGVSVDCYMAVEIDSRAAAIASANHHIERPTNDVKELKMATLPPIDLFLAGFPCQDFSKAGKQQGFDGENGKLFFAMVRILRQLRPRVFLLENVPMGLEVRQRINRDLGFTPVQVESRNYGAQNRSRLFWSNIGFTPRVRYSDVMIKDVLLDDHGEELRSYTAIKPRGKWSRIVGTIKSDGQLANNFNGVRAGQEVFSENGKLNTLVAGNRAHVRVNAVQCRKVSVEEACLFQGLPADYCISEEVTGHAYKALGNAFDVHVVKELLGQILRRANLC